MNIVTRDSGRGGESRHDTRVRLSDLQEIKAQLNGMSDFPSSNANRNHCHQFYGIIIFIFPVETLLALQIHVIMEQV